MVTAAVIAAATPSGSEGAGTTRQIGVPVIAYRPATVSTCTMALGSAASSSPSTSICWTHPWVWNRTVNAASPATSRTPCSGPLLPSGHCVRTSVRVSSVTRSRILETSMEWALWLMNATIERIATTPSTTASAMDRLGTTGAAPLSSRGPRTARSTIRQ